MNILKDLDLIIPSEWNKVRLATIANVIDPEPSHRAPALADGEGFPYIGIRDVNNDGTVNTVTARPIKEESLIEQEKRFTINNGDLIFCRVATLGNPKIIKLDTRVALSATLALIKPKRDLVNNMFLLYLLDSDYIKQQTKLYATGSTRKSLGMETIRKFEVLLPPIHVQNIIAAYLFKKISLIENIIKVKERYISLLEQQRQSIITEAVTKGLNPNVKMKDSGVEWIGEIPEYWNVTKIKRISQIKRGASPRPIDDPKYFDENGDYAWVRIADVSKSNMYLERTKEKMSELGASLSVKREPGDIFVSIAGTVGKPCITNIKCCIHDGFVYFPNYKHNVKFLYYIFDSGEPYKGLGKMGTQLNLNTETVGMIDIPLPSEGEQTEIVTYLEETLAKHFELINTIQIQIEKLKEYRQSLIYEAVTGKIDVRDMELD